MAKALIGSTTTPSELRLLDEIRSLRARVTELEEALEEAEKAAEDRSDLMVVDDAAGVGA